MSKKSLTVFLSLLLTLTATFPAFAVEGWQKEGDSWYYYRNDNKLTNEWITENDQTYYVGPDGKMAVGMQIIDGYYYNFESTGEVPKNVEFEIWRDQEIVYDKSGRGVAIPMKPTDALYSSTCVQWMDQTFGIYEHYRGEMSYQADLYAVSLPRIEELLARDWGITTKDEGIAVINSLFESGKSTEDKSVKAWNFSRAMMLCKFMWEPRWIEMDECRNMQFAMAPTIQQSFTSWEDFNDNYMIGYRKWANLVGLSQKSKDDREVAYKRTKDQINQSNEDRWTPWNKELVKYW